MLELDVEIFERYTGGPVDPEGLRAQAAKRVGLQFVVRYVASFDHRKLEDRYSGRTSTLKGAGSAWIFASWN